MKKDNIDPLTGEPLRNHEYDGIQEFDNRLPNWWLWTFYGAIIFTVLYWFSWYDADLMKDDGARVDAQMEKVEEIRLAAIGDLSPESLWQMSGNSGFVAKGEEVYQSKCATCHGPNLEGGIGLSLVDDNWRWGNNPISIYTMVAEGSPDKQSGMQAWMNELGPQKVSQVTAYVLSHHTIDDMMTAETENPPIGL